MQILKGLKPYNRSEVRPLLPRSATQITQYTGLYPPGQGRQRDGI